MKLVTGVGNEKLEITTCHSIMTAFSPLTVFTSSRTPDRFSNPCPTTRNGSGTLYVPSSTSLASDGMSFPPPCATMTSYAKTSNLLTPSVISAMMKKVITDRLVPRKTGCKCSLKHDKFYGLSEMHHCLDRENSYT